MSEKQAPAPVMRKRRETALGALLGRHLDSASAGGDAGLSGRLAMQWASVCPLYAPYCWPLAVRKGVLSVAVTSDPVKQELFYMAPTLMEACNMVAGYEAVSSLRFERRALGSRTAGALKVVKGSRKPDAGSAVLAQEACAGVADGDLKDALARLGGWVIRAPARSGGR